MESLHTMFNDLGNLETAVRNRLFYGAFCALIAVILLYFWQLARRSVGKHKVEGGALVFLALAYLLYFVIAVALVYNPVAQAKLTLSSLVNICLLLALPFFAERDYWLDRIVRLSNWRNGVYLLAAFLLVLISWTQGADWLFTLDQVWSILSFSLLAFFLGRYFWQHGLRFLTFVSTAFFLLTIVLVWNPGELLAGGKFAHPNMTIFVPALALSTILLSYSFNWISDLQFREVSGIWLSPKTADDTAESETPDSLEARLAQDELEGVIEALILQKRSRNESLEMIINVASRNTRNNNQRLKELVSQEHYQIERNKISQALLYLIAEKD